MVFEGSPDKFRPEQGTASRPSRLCQAAEWQRVGNTKLRGLIRRVSHGHRSGIRKVFLAQPGNEARRRCAGLQIVLLVLVRLRRFDCGRGALDNQTEDPSALAALNRAWEWAPPESLPGGRYGTSPRESPHAHLRSLSWRTAKRSPVRASASVGAPHPWPLAVGELDPIPFDTWPVAELRCWQRVCMPEKRPITGGLKCVSYWLAQLSSQLRLDLQGAFTTSKPPTLNRSRARRSNSLGGPIGMD
jgi:hypothetical protein